MLVSGLIQGASRLGQLIDAGADDLTVEDLGRQLAQEVDAYLRESPEEADIREPDLAWEAEYIPDAEYVPETEHVPETQPVAEPEQKASGFDIDSAENQAYIKKQRRQRQVLINKAQGDAFEKERFPNFAAEAFDAETQVSIRNQEGTLMIVDAIGYDSKRNMIIMEYKSSLTARVSNNQKEVFDSLREREARVVGKGKGVFTRGMRIPPTSEGTTIIVERPGQREEW